MQKNTWIWAVLAVVIVAGIGIYAYDSSTKESMPAAAETGANSYATSTSSPTDTSDAAIQQDTAAIDSQMQGVSADNQSVNEGLGTSVRP